MENDLFDSNCIYRERLMLLNKHFKRVRVLNCNTKMRYKLRISFENKAISLHFYSNRNLQAMDDR